MPGTFNLDDLMIRLGYKEDITLTRDEFMALVNRRPKHLDQETECQNCGSHLVVEFEAAV